MPTYEYRCDKCSVEFERVQRISDDPIRTCPECGARKVKRLISATSFVLKGGGWYSDLYSAPRKAERSGDGKSGDGKSDAAASAGTKSDAGASKSTDTSKSKSDTSAPASEGKSEGAASGSSSKSSDATA